MATKIAAGAGADTNVVWMIEFQERLIERLYRKLNRLLLEDQNEDDDKYSYQYED